MCQQAPRPSTGPHKLRDSLPLVILLRQRLKYALTYKEAMMILKNRLVEVDGRARTDLTFPAGFMDTISIPATNKYYRMLYDVKGRYTPVSITKEEAKVGARHRCLKTEHTVCPQSCPTRR